MDGFDRAAVFFTGAVLVHNLDHLRRGADSVTTDVFALGSLAILFEVGVVALVFARHRLAPLAAAVVGFQLAVGYLFVHFTPARSWLSDSFPDGDVSALSWIAGGLETAAALGLGVAGLAARRRAAQAPMPRRAYHPVVLTGAAGNLAIFIGFLATR